ncbi:hypothetical protein [Limosilactobacillus pontis]|uniref:Uncharacterized protein n=1 Tax=Limosilactobacillus pontis TaxID=35787 RepID=A0ABU7STW6_9LACO
MELDTQLNASDRSARETISKNFQTIQSEDANDDGAFTKYQEETNDHLNKLDTEKATHDDVEELRSEMYQIRDNWNDRASHIALGTDVETTKAVVEQILQEKGLI